MSKLRSTVYAHMEETSFRSGAVFGAGALAVTGTAIALAVILTGHSAGAISAPGPSAPARPAPPASATASPSVTPSSTPATRTSPTSPGYVPASRVTPVTTPQTAPSASSALGPLRRPYGGKFPDYRGRPFPLFRPWGGPPGHPGYRAGLSMWQSGEQPRF